MTERSRDPAKRQMLQESVDRFVAKRATEQDLNNFRDRELMYHGTMEQACQFIKAIPRQESVSPDVLYAWAETLRIRVEQSPSKNKDPSPRLPNGKPTFKVPPGWR